MTDGPRGRDLGEQVRAAARAVRAGGVVALPTETVYGIGADPASAVAVSRLFALKQRPEGVPLAVLVAEPAEAESLALLGPAASALAARYWPGPLTIVLARRPGLGLHLGGDDSTVGVRCPDQPVAGALLRLTGPLAVTSANVHTEEPARDAAGVRRAFPAGLDAVIDAGRCEGTPSTVVSLVGDGPVVLREGAIEAGEVLAVSSSRPASGR